MNKDKTKSWRVDIYESECGWGGKVDDSIYFDTYEEAEAYRTEYNEKYNPPGPAPDWYMVALEPVRNKIT